ncbi:MAG: MFS transporter [Ktedonobacteraceae bacterium]
MYLFVEYFRQFGRFQRNARLYLISNALSGVTAGILLVLYNLYLLSLGYAADFIGAVLFAATIGAGLAIFPAGVYVDRFSGKAILIGANLLVGVAGIGQILFRQPLPLLLSGFIAGVGFAFILVVNAPFLTANSTPDERPHLFSLNLVLTLITAVVGNIVGGLLPVWFRQVPLFMAPLPPWLNVLLASQPNARAYQLSMLFAGIIVLPSLIPLFLLSNDPPPGRRSSRQPSTLRRGGSSEDVGRGPLPSPSSLAPITSAMERAATKVLSLANTSPIPVRTNAKQWLAMLPTILRSPIFTLSLVQALIGAGAGLFISYFNIYFVQHLNASPALFGLLSGGTVAIAALFTLAAPWLAARIGKVNSIALTQLMSIPLLVTLGLTSLLPLAAVCYLFRQGLMDMSNGVLQVFSMEVAPRQHRGLANSSYQVAFQVPWALTAPLGGLLIAHFGYSPIFLGAAACYLLAIATLWSKFGGSREKRFEHT